MQRPFFWIEVVLSGVLFACPAVSFAQPALVATDQGGALAMSTEVLMHAEFGEQSQAAAATSTGVAPSASTLVLLVRGAFAEHSGMHGTPGSPAAVRDRHTLTQYASAQLLSDPNIGSVALSSDGISLNYDIPAKLLGFLPMHAEAHVVVSKNGDADVTYPWYGFLLSSKSADLQALIAEQAKARLASANTEALSPETQALLLDEIHGILQNDVGKSHQSNA